MRRRGPAVGCRHTLETPDSICTTLGGTEIQSERLVARFPKEGVNADEEIEKTKEDGERFYLHGRREAELFDVTMWGLILLSEVARAADSLPPNLYIFLYFTFYMTLVEKYPN